MKTLAFTALILCATSLEGRASDINGKCISEMEVGDADGKTYTHTTRITLKNDNGSLTGTIVQTSAAPWMSEMSGRSIDIIDGKVEGDKFSFKVKLETTTGDRTAVYEGTVEGNHLRGTIKYRGIGQSRPLDAKRAD